MSIFKKPLVEVKKVNIGGTDISFCAPNTFDYREYIRRLNALYSKQSNKKELEDVSLDLEKDTLETQVTKLHRLMDQSNEITILQIVACCKYSFPNETWDELIKDFTLNAHDVLFQQAEPLVREFLRLDELEEASEDEKKPSTPTKNSSTD